MHVTHEAQHCTNKEIVYAFGDEQQLKEKSELIFSAVNCSCIMSKQSDRADTNNDMLSALTTTKNRT